MTERQFTAGRRPLNKDEQERVEWIFKYIAINDDYGRLGDLEIVESMETQYNKDHMLSDSQLDLLEKIYERT